VDAEAEEAAGLGLVMSEAGKDVADDCWGGLERWKRRWMTTVAE